jgi:cytochrome c oxidase subunit 1
MSEFWGKVHFWLSLSFMNLVFQPMFAQGMGGMIRRMYNGGATYSLDLAPGEVGVLPSLLKMNVGISHAAWLLGIVQIPFIINFFWSIKHGKKITSDNPWDSTTLEWQTPTPPPHGNFTKAIEVNHGPYEYSVPGHGTDFTPQNEPIQGKR